MLRMFRQSLLMLLWLSIVTGIAYPLAVSGLARLLFPQQAAGSLIERDGRVLGSALIGQPFSDPGYFWGRPSATSPMPYNAGASSGSNLGPTNPALRAAVAERIAALRAADLAAGVTGTGSTPVPVDLVTASASGLDPDISPAAAAYQAARVARVRGLDEATVRRLIAEHTEARQFGFLGEPRVNVLELNLALGPIIVR